MEHKTTDQIFNDTYSQKGMQPSVGVRQIIKTKKTSTYNNKPDQQTTYDNGIRRIKKEIGGRNTEPAGTAGEVVEKNTEQKQVKQKPKRYYQTKQKIKIKSKVKNKSNRKKVLIINRSLYSFNLGILWFFVQLPFALISAVLFGVSLAISSFAKGAIASEEAGFLEKIATWAYNTLAAVVTTLAEAFNAISEYLFGFSFLEALNPMNWFFVTYAVLLAFFIIQLFLIYLLYKFAGVEPLLGKKAGLKTGTFLMAITLYCIPLLNIIPWFILWTLAVYTAED